MRALLDPRDAIASVVAPKAEKVEAEAAPVEGAVPAEGAAARRSGGGRRGGPGGGRQGRRGARRQAGGKEEKKGK